MEWEFLTKLGLGGLIGLIAIEKSFAFARWTMQRRNGQPKQEITGTIKIDSEQWTDIKIHHAEQTDIAKDVKKIRDKVTN